MSQCQVLLSRSSPISALNNYNTRRQIFRKFVNCANQNRSALALNATLSKSKYANVEDEVRLCSAGFDIPVSSDGVVRDKLSPANEASLFTSGFEHPSKPKLSGIDKLNACFSESKKVISKPQSLLKKRLLRFAHRQCVNGWQLGNRL